MIARAPVRPGEATDALEAAVREDVVRDPFGGTFGGPGPTTGSVVRFLLPAGVSSAGLVLHSPFGSAEFWQDGAWRRGSCDAPGCVAQSGVGSSGGSAVPPCPPNVACGPRPTPVLGKPGGAGVPIVVPEGAVRDGILYARVPGPASLSQGIQLTVGRAS